MATPYQRLFSPIALGRKSARNRIMRVATTCLLADQGRVGEREIAFYRAVARGGTGTIVTEALPVHPATRLAAGFLRVFDRDVIPGLQALSRAVHEEGALLLGQLNQAGRQHHLTSVPTMAAPSAIPCPKSGGTPHEMTEDEVEEMIGHYVAGAVNLAEGGLDGVEIHGAQGHLIGQFLSPFSNQRTDSYGGSFDGRLRFPRTILRRVRERLGVDAIIGFRLCVEEFTPGGITVEDAVAIARALAEERLVDYLSLSQGNFNTIEKHLPDRHFPPLAFLVQQERIKQAVPDVPVVVCNQMKAPEQAEAVLERGQADMIGLCRPLIADPDWVAKAETGHADDIRKCISCNQCWLNGGPIHCTTNPRAGRELFLDRMPAPASRLRVVVVGGGPAGLEAARNAALRGHDVVLFEREQELGGKIRAAARAPNFADLGYSIDFLIRQVRNANIEVRTGAEADVTSILALSPDAVIVASGAAVVAPALDGDGSVPVIASAEPLPAITRPGQIVIMDEDGHYWAAAAAESAAAAGRDPIIVTRFFEPFREVPLVSRITALRALDLAGGETRTTKYVDRVENGQVVLRHYYSGREERIADCAAVLWVGRQKTRDGLAAELRAAGFDRVRLIGDAYQPRRLKDAIHEGHDAAMSL